MTASTVHRSRLSVRPPPFASEAEMTTVAAAAWRRWWLGERKPDFIAAEVVAPGAIADLVAGSFDYEAVAARHAADVWPLTDWSSLLCALACRRPSTANEVALAVGLSSSGARRSLKTATAHGALLRDGRHVILNDHWRPAVTRLVALELKLRDWQKGLVQAARYRTWADASWLILGATALTHASRATREAGVGLARLSPSGAWANAHGAMRRRPGFALERRWAEEQVLAQALRAGWRPEQVREPAATYPGELAVAVG